MQDMHVLPSPASTTHAAHRLCNSAKEHQRSTENLLVMCCNSSVHMVLALLRVSSSDITF